MTARMVSLASPAHGPPARPGGQARERSEESPDQAPVARAPQTSPIVPRNLDPTGSRAHRHGRECGEGSSYFEVHNVTEPSAAVAAVSISSANSPGSNIWRFVSPARPASPSTVP